MKTGIELITKERKRQIEKKGWTKEHDSGHVCGELATAAACYASPDEIFEIKSSCKTHLILKDPFPFGYTVTGRSMMDSDGFRYYTTKEKKEGKSRLEQLVIAGALIAAEIDRLQSNQQQPLIKTGANKPTKP